MGVAFCVLFAWWFVSGIFMMYWDYPAVGAEERLLHAPPIDANRIKLTPAEAFAALGGERDPAGVQLAMLDGRPVYRFGAAGGGGGVIDPRLGPAAASCFTAGLAPPACGKF